MLSEETARTLIEKIEHLDRSAGDKLVDLAKQSKRDRRILRALIVSFVLNILLTVFVVIGLVQLQSLTSRLDAAQSTGRQNALCPLYQLFLDSRSDKARAASPQGPEAYDNAFKIIQKGYDALECQEFIKPPE